MISDDYEVEAMFHPIARQCPRQSHGAPGSVLGSCNAGLMHESMHSTRDMPARVALLNTAGDGVVVPPFGLFGATDGLPHHYTIVSDGAERVLGSKEVGVVVNPGDHIICLSSGGGGYGRLEDRDKEALTWDLKNGYVTG